MNQLEPLPKTDSPALACPSSIKWHLVDDDAPGWEDAWSVVDLKHVDDDDEATDAFFKDFNRYAQTKVGGYPDEIQHGVGLENFVFQVGSEEKAHWMWANTKVPF